MLLYRTLSDNPHGIGVAGYHPEGSKLAHFLSEESKAGASMAIFSVGGNLGFGFGPMLAVFVLSFAGLKSIQGVMIPGALAGLFFMALLPRFKSILAERAHNHKKNLNQTAKSRVRVGSLIILLLYVTIRSWIQSGLVYFIPFYFPSFRGIAQPEYLVSTFLIAGAVGTILGGPFADFQSHYGSAPISIVWKMKESLPGFVMKKTVKV